MDITNTTDACARIFPLTDARIEAQARYSGNAPGHSHGRTRGIVTVQGFLSPDRDAFAHPTARLASDIARKAASASENGRNWDFQGENEHATAQIWNSYSAKIEALINARGGLRREWTWIEATEFHKLGYRPC